MVQRTFLSFTLVCLLILAGNTPASASSSVAHQTLETAVNKILAVVMNPAYPDPQQRLVLNKTIEAEVRTIFDFQEFSMRTVGPAWRSFTPDQQQRFSTAFADLLIYTYLGKVDKYNGEKIVYTGDKSDSAAQRVEIQTLLTLKDSKPIPVAYRMLPKNGSWFVYDVLVEGISLVKNYRTQFQDILSKNSVDQLIQRVDEKAQDMRERSNVQK
ncbi:MAG: ABC transporter substrate-binding protein [Desulfovibrionaceae bacterium]